MIICRKDAKDAKKSMDNQQQKNLYVLCAVQGRTNFHVAPGRAGDVDAVQGRTNVARDRMSGATVFAAKTSYFRGSLRRVTPGSYIIPPFSSRRPTEQ